MSDNSNVSVKKGKRVTKKEKKDYCKKGTRRNKLTNECEPIKQAIISSPKQLINEIKNIGESLLRFRPITISKPQYPEQSLPPQPIQPPQEEPAIPKKRKLVIGCSKEYNLKESDMPRKAELEALSGPKLRKIHSELINDPSVLNHTPGVKTKDELIRLIICLENEKRRQVVLPVAETVAKPSILEQLPSIFTKTKSLEEIPNAPPAITSEKSLPDSTPEEEQMISNLVKTKKLVIREPLPEVNLDEEEKIELPIEKEITKEIEPSAVSEEALPSVEEKSPELEITSQEEAHQDELKIPPIDKTSKQYNEFLFEKEKLESENLKNNKTLEFLYPELNDSNFNIKIAKRKEFTDTTYNGTVYDIKEQANKLCDADFELLPHQLFVKNFLSMQTPYNSLLLYHELGTGKTCSSIGIAEEMRAYMKQIGLNQQIMIVASPNVQQNYRLQLFDERKLKLVNGVWTSNTCVGNALLKEINPTNLVGIPRDRIISEVNTIINRYYAFMGYTELANYIKRHTLIPEGVRFTMEEQKKLRIRKIQKYFNNRLIIIDEAHNIRISDENREEAKTATLLMDIVRTANNMRLLLLSATPMYNSYKEIIWMTNLLNAIDFRATIQESDVFDKNGNFLKERKSKDGKKIEGGRELLQRKLTGYVSYVRGENPYTFPYRIYPDTFSIENSLSSLVEGNKYPSKQLNRRTIEEPLKFIPAFIHQIGQYQSKGYDFIMNHLRKKTYSVTTKFGEIRELPSFENMESFGYTLLMQPLEALNIIFPNQAIDELPETNPEGSPMEESESESESKKGEPYNEERNEEIIKNIIGRRGLFNIMTRKEEKAPIPNIYDFEYKPQVLSTYGKIFHSDNINKYSSKIAKICETIRNSEGIILVYSQYIEGGVVPIALALEEMGFSRFSTASHAKSLFKTPPTEPLDSMTMKPYQQFIDDGGKREEFQPAKYVMITGNKAYSPDNLADIKYITQPNNKNGERVKVIIISKAAAEGLDFKCIRQVHILEPWYNMSRIEQIIGRGVRNLSHCALEFEKRNVEIYLHATLPRNEEEPADLYVYRFAEKKASQIGKVTRLLKETSVDCLLNISQTNFTIEKLSELAQNQNINIRLSSQNGKEVLFKIGDRPFTQICDYSDNCSFTCSPSETIQEADIIQDTYNNDFLKMNYVGIVKRIRELFREHNLYKRDKLINSINILKSYPTSHIDYALSRFVDNPEEYVFDRWGRTGYIINKDDLYIFQPIEITDKEISLFERERPVDYKREYLEIDLPKEKAPLILEEDEETKEGIENLDVDKPIHEKYEIILGEYKKSLKTIEEWRTKKSEGSRIPAGESDWYMNIGYVFDRIIEYHEISENEIWEFVAHHFLDTLTLDERITIVKYLYSLGENGEPRPDNTENRIFKQYFDKKILNIRGNRCIVLISDLLVDSSEERIRIFVQDKSDLLVWQDALPTDRETAIRESIKKYLVQKNQLYRLIGFMQVFKSHDVVFKTIDRENKLKKGSRCGGEGKKDIIKKINMISVDFKYTEENTEDENLIIKPGMCVILEMVTRYYTKTRQNDLVWFMDLEEVVFNRLVN